MERIRSLLALKTEDELGVSTWVAIFVAVFVSQMLWRKHREEDDD